MTAVTIIMPCYNRSYDLLRTLEAYEHQTTSEPFEIIAVDDGSSDTTFDILKSYQPRHYQLKPIRLPTNQGPSAARNAALEHVSAPLIIFVGDDIVPSTDFVEAHSRAHRTHSDPGIAILGKIAWADDVPQNTLMKHIDGPGAQQFSYFYLKHGIEYDYRHFYTANVSIKREMFDVVDEWFDCNFVYAYEDPELAYRMSKHGLHILYDSSICGTHYHYHSIWSFGVRQQRCGRIAWVFVKKHPKVWKDVLPEFYWHLGLAFSKMITPSSSGLSERMDFEAEALHLACYYEWKQNHLLDYLYIEILKYFYYKGALEVFLAKSPVRNRMLAAYTKGKLLPVLRRFVREAHASNVALPEGFGENKYANL